MKPKKNPHKDLNRDQSLYFVIALLLVLLMTLLALEWKTYDSNYNYDTSMNLEEELMEEVPITIHYKTPPPAPVQAPPVIEITKDKDEIEETFIADSETNQEEEILDVEDIEVDEITEEPEAIPFILIEEVPVFPGCEKAKDKRACFQAMMKKHISKHFRYPEIALEMGIEGRVNTMFVIQKDGSIGNVQMRGPDKSLEVEAQRIIDKLPKMVPGKQRGAPVKVPFSLPIIFKLQ